MIWPFIASGVGAAAMLGAAFFVGKADGVQEERLRHQTAALEAVAATDKTDKARLDELANALVTLAENDARAETARLEAMKGLRRAISENRPSPDGCRITADDAERLRNIVAAANAARAVNVRSGIESDEGRARKRDNPPSP